jgi:mannosyltransferase OCH1-like enzyme
MNRPLVGLCLLIVVLFGCILVQLSYIHPDMLFVALGISIIVVIYATACPRPRPSMPYIIHQTAPSDKKKWHDQWFKCQDTWKKYWKNAEYKMWSDDDLRDLVATHYSWFLPTYDSYDQTIKRVDMARYFILHKYGGIYADMDMECLRNFYADLPQNDPSVVGSPYTRHEQTQNSLMSSPPGNPFWMHVVKTAQSRTHLPNVLDATGPRMLDEALATWKLASPVHILPHDKFNPRFNDHERFNNPNINCRHHLTSVYGISDNPSMRRKKK